MQNRATTSWNFAEVWETVAERLPKAPAYRHGARRATWEELDRRADGIAKALLDAGAGRHDKVAQYLYNSPEYMESVFGSFKAGLAPVNTNYRYGDDEIAYLWDNADAFAVVFHGVFTGRIKRLRKRVPGVKVWLWVDDETEPCPGWAIPYEEAAASAAERSIPRWGRTPDDLVLLYTGGTTGMPKGVMWRQDDLFSRLNHGNVLQVPEGKGIEGVRKTLTGRGPVHLPACPLMHGTGMFTTMAMMNVGGCVVTLANRAFDPEELLDVVDREHVNTLAIVGDAFAKPILRVLDENPRRWNLSTLLGIVSSGVMWSTSVKEGLLRHHPTMMLLDEMSSSEAVGVGVSVSSGASAEKTAHFRLGPDVKVLREDGSSVEPGSSDAGVLALGGRNPLGYYKDPAKSAATFKEIGGVRYSIPGDWATVDADGTIQLLGRGSVCINTGGEKVFPEEVEEVLKTHPLVGDAIAVGIPDDRFGEVVSAVVELRGNERPAPSRTKLASLDARVLTEYVKQRLAAYKAPRYVRFVDSIGRAPTGKVDYRRHRDEMVAWLEKQALVPAG
jgi:fatty-acyl-CoA synthase